MYFYYFMQYLFVLGRDGELSKLEIESVLELNNIEFKIVDANDSVLVLDIVKLDPKIINEFGGVIKIAKVISSTTRMDQVEQNLDKAELYVGTKNKIEYYIDAMNTGLLSFVEDYLKDYFKTIRVKAMYKSNNEPSKLVNKDILREGLNLVIFKGYIGKAIAITDPREFKRRDLARPEVDHMKVISIRLAKILVNLTKVKKEGTLLDAFCGSGTILQEALLKGINVFGIDKDQESVKQAEKNITWLINEFRLKNFVKIINWDSANLSGKLQENSVDGVATEPYMGPYIRKLPNMGEARKLVLELSELYSNLLKSLKKVLKKNARVVIVIPKFKTRENRIIMIDFKIIAESNGFSLAFKPIQYGYKENKLLREIYVLENN